MTDSLGLSEPGGEILEAALKTVEDHENEASRMVRRHFRLEKRRTSICLHPEEWDMFDSIAKRLGCGVKELVNDIDVTRGDSSVPSAIRIFMLDYWRNLARANAGAQARLAGSAASSVMSASAPHASRSAARPRSFTV